MTETTTSAGQLYSILERALAYGDKTQGMSVWSSAINFSGQKIEFHEAISQFLILCFTVKQDIAELGEPFYQLCTKAIQKAEASIIYNNLHESWGEIKRKSKIGEDTFHVIKCSDELLKKSQCQQINLTEEKKEELLSKINQLIDDFRDSNLPDNLKLELIAKLRKIQNALIYFQITGEAQLQKVCNEVIGDIITKASEKPKLFKQFKQSVQQVINIAVIIGGLMTTCDLSIKYYPILTESIINIIDNLPEKDDKNPKLTAELITQEMKAEIENNKCLPSS